MGTPTECETLRLSLESSLLTYRGNQGKMRVSNRMAFLCLHQQRQLVLFTLLQNSYNYLQRQERGKDWRKGDRKERGGEE